MAHAGKQEVMEYIEEALAELRSVAPPRDLASLRELLLDVEETTEPEDLRHIAEQAQNLRSFLEKRAKSSTSMDSVRPPPGRRFVS